MKRLLLLISSIISMFILYGCHKKPIHYPIRILAYNEEQGVLEEIISNFKKTYAPIENEITITYIDSKEALKKDVDFFRDYDIFAIQTEQVEKLIEKKIIVENTLHSRQVMIYNAGGAAKAADHKGRIFNFPYTANTYLLFYDNTIYNTNDVKELQKMFTKEKSSDWASLGINLNDPYSLLSFYFGGKVQVFPDWDLFRVTLDSEQGIEITEYISKLKSNGVRNLSYDEASNLFKMKKIAAIIAPIEYASIYKDSLGERFAVALLPEVQLECDNSKFKLRPPVWVNMYSVNINAKSLNTASELTYYITSLPAQHLRFQKKRVFPTQKQLNEKQDVKDDKLILIHLEQLQYAIPPPITKKLDKFWIEFPLLMNELYEGRVYNIEDRIKELSNKIRNA